MKKNKKADRSPPFDVGVINSELGSFLDRIKSRSDAIRNFTISQSLADLVKVIKV